MNNDAVSNVSVSVMAKATGLKDIEARTVLTALESVGKAVRTGLRPNFQTIQDGTLKPLVGRKQTLYSIDSSAIVGLLGADTVKALNEASAQAKAQSDKEILTYAAQPKPAKVSKDADADESADDASDAA